MFCKEHEKLKSIAIHAHIYRYIFRIMINVQATSKVSRMKRLKMSQKLRQKYR